MEFRIGPFFNSTRRIYLNWRWEISRKIKENRTLKVEDPIHFTGFSAQDYTQAIKNQIVTKECSLYEDDELANCLCSSLASDAEKNTNQTDNNEYNRLRDLYCAKTKIARTFSQVLFLLHDHYCVVENSAGISELIPFSNIHGELTAREDMNEKVSSCFNVKNEFEDMRDPEDPEDIGWILKEEIGYPLFPKVFSTKKNYVSRDNRLTENFSADYMGSMTQRHLAGTMFRIGSYLKKPGSEETVSRTPVTLMDEPDIRDRLQKRVINRITHGN